MDRKEFIRTCGITCAGGLALGSLLTSCGSSKMIQAAIEGSDLIVPLSAFMDKSGKKEEYKSHVIAHNSNLQYPVCIYRLDTGEYKALLLKCTHQGAELQVFGDKLQCPAHGSEFNKEGAVTNGPADRNLRTFPVTADQQQLKISLK